jgi:hypothetical protein
VENVLGLGIMAALDTALWAAIRRWFPSVDGVAVWGAILAANALLVAWCYAWLTAGILRATAQTAELSRQERDERQRPCVVVSREITSAPPGLPPGWLYSAENVGPGVALQVAIVVKRGDDTEYVRLGPIAAGGRVVLPTRLQDALGRADPGIDTVRLVAQPLVGAEWCFYAGVMEPSKQLSARIYYQIPDRALVDGLRSASLEDLSEEAWRQLQAGPRR